MLTWDTVLEFANGNNLEPNQRIEKTPQEWREMLTPEQFMVTREKGTERPFSSEMCGLYESGEYACVCCDTLLFDSQTKFDSGTGWPSFDQPIAENAIAYIADNSHGMTRVETVCSTCDSHLGHVFPDGPAPGGLRYCMNALSLKKV